MSEEKRAVAYLKRTVTQLVKAHKAVSHCATPTRLKNLRRTKVNYEAACIRVLTLLEALRKGQS